MKSDIEVVCFDLFHTLAEIRDNGLMCEKDVLKISKEEWEKYAEDDELYEIRATGKEKHPIKIIEAIINKMQIRISENEKEEILKLREEKFKKSLIDIDTEIIRVLSNLKKSGKRICLISNADIIDVMHWEESPLRGLFDEVVFSYEVGFLKPQAEIYEIALEKMQTRADKCIFVGDGGSDELKGAKKLGIKTILTGYLIKRNREQLDRIKEYADYYVKDFKEIEDICI